MSQLLLVIILFLSLLWNCSEPSQSTQTKEIIAHKNEPEKKYAIHPSGVILRKGAGRNYEKILIIPQNSPILVIEKTLRKDMIESREGVWVKVIYTDSESAQSEGFVFDGFLGSLPVESIKKIENISKKCAKFNPTKFPQNFKGGRFIWTYKNSMEYDKKILSIELNSDNTAIIEKLENQLSPLGLEIENFLYSGNWIIIGKTIQVRAELEFDWKRDCLECMNLSSDVENQQKELQCRVDCKNKFKKGDKYIKDTMELNIQLNDYEQFEFELHQGDAKKIEPTDCLEEL